MTYGWLELWWGFDTCDGCNLPLHDGDRVFVCEDDACSVRTVIVATDTLHVRGRLVEVVE